MKLAIIESPYAGDIERNTAYARECMRWAILNEYAPFASHLLYTQVLDDSIKYQRSHGIAMGYHWLFVADIQLIFTDYGISPGMESAMSVARDHGIEQKFIKLYK